jgi:hypothetical protein
VGPHSQRLGALAGRVSLPSSSALSRALAAVEVDLLRPASTWLLTQVGEVDTVLQHPTVQSYDTHGCGWHVFDVDPTVTALRHRALPVGDDLPEPKRRSEDIAAPGYKGRKRGDVVLRRATAQHAGSSIWVHTHLSPGNGDGVEDFALALDSIVETCERIGHPTSRALVRMDGEHGNVPWYTACRERGLPFVTRLNRPKLYEEPDVLEKLRSATWYEVEDSRCGPQRAAAELGVFTLSAGSKTRRPDGTRYETVKMRVVACRFPKSGQAKRGHILDGWEVELFAVDVPADAWPAPEAMTAYYRRNALENRLAQEDRELGLDRLLSYELPGQELAALVALSLWNLRVARGFALETPPLEQPVQRLRAPRLDERAHTGWPRDPVTTRILNELDWPALLKNERGGWSFDAASGDLVCGDGRMLTLTTVRQRSVGKTTTGIIFRRPTGGCQECSVRPDCLHTERSQASKHAEFSVPTDLADRLRARLARVRGKAEVPRKHIEPVTEASGPRAVHDALFLPAEARKLFRSVFTGATVHVDVEVPPQQLGPRLLAFDVADRQRRRKTWEQNRARHALPDDAVVSIHVAGGAKLQRALGHPSRMKAGVGGTS